MLKKSNRIIYSSKNLIAGGTRKFVISAATEKIEFSQLTMGTPLNVRFEIFQCTKLGRTIQIS